eukprot:TRINITY_DN3999_c0_g1_i1.p1 TRINITY_DN3999_c0_g1~~TRINITY_DN3999_c0_g1_i1.p1  ORF type:complete len:391 (-),score=58.50 TRINITY_DN3999_c0_g1_i1:58-1230(-)
MTSSNHLFLGFDYPSYVPGRKVEGVVVLVVQVPIKVKSVSIRWQGNEFVSWFQGVRYQNEVTASTNMFEQVQVLWPTINDPSEKDLEEEPKIIVPGTYTYKFSWDLPTNLPSNYEERDADKFYVMASNSLIPKTFGKNKSYIRYVATAFVDIIPDEREKESSKPKLEYTSYFRVIEMFDPKIIIQPPRVVQGTKSFLMGGDPLKAKISVANAGVLFSGQRIALNLSVDNKSSRDINSVLLHLEEHTSFTVESECLSRKNVVIHAQIPESKIPANSVFNRDLMMDTPRQLPCSILSGKFIKRQYELIVELVASMGTNLQLRSPLVLLGWSPLIKDDVPRVVPININPEVVNSESTQETKTDVSNEKEPLLSSTDRDADVKEESDASEVIPL